MCPWFHWLTLQNDYTARKNKIITQTTSPTEPAKGSRNVVSLKTGATDNWVKDSMGNHIGKTDKDNYYFRGKHYTSPEDRKVLETNSRTLFPVISLNRSIYLF